jgi:septal ring factor EnvC (AmiA/AmiB activator)
MKSTVEFVDEFIEDLFKGNVETRIEKVIGYFKTISPKRDDGGEVLLEVAKDLDKLSKVIAKYRKESDTQKKAALAEKIFDEVVSSRLYGLLENNPNTQKELDFYKDENTRLRGENNQLREHNTTLAQQLETYFKTGAKPYS